MVEVGDPDEDFQFRFTGHPLIILIGLLCDVAINCDFSLRVVEFITQLPEPFSQDIPHRKTPTSVVDKSSIKIYDTEYANDCL